LKPPGGRASRAGARVRPGLGRLQLVAALVRQVLRLRYRIRVHGLGPIRRRGTRGILFLPTHPALIDPVILTTELLRDFQARPFADQGSVDLPGVRWFARQVGAFQIPSVAHQGTEALAAIEGTLQDSIQALRDGDNVILYPAGGILRSRFEVVGASSAVGTILKALPEVRVVLVKTRGLWGSGFSKVYGHDPDLRRILRRGLASLLASFVFLMPRRRVDLTFEEPQDLPRTADRMVLNSWLEARYNQDAPPALYVPYTPWEGGGPRELPEPSWGSGTGTVADVPTGTRRLVEDHLAEVTGVAGLRDSQELARDLGMDSLARAELLSWLQAEFGLPPGNTDSVRTVADVLLAACGEVASDPDVPVPPPPTRWFRQRGDAVLSLSSSVSTVPEAFLTAARRAPDRAALADASSGVKTYRDLVVGILALQPALRALPGQRVGLMMPASVAAGLAYLAVLFSGRTPVLFNWTVGRRTLVHGLELTGVQAVLTVRPLVAGLKQQGLDLAGVEEHFVYLEDLGSGLGRWARLWAWFRARLWWGSLEASAVPEVAAILFTSGSESLPKAVPLTHANFLVELRDILAMVGGSVSGRDRLLAILPPFHSFGLAANVILPLVAGIPTVYYPNPTEGPALARTLGAYRASVILSTPTFLAGMLRAARTDQLASLRLAVTGAEECPLRVYQLRDERCPQALLLEGYGITECAPVVSLNLPQDPRPNTLGRLLPSLEHALVSVETGQPVGPDVPGLLLLRGPTVFPGYLGDAPDPFVEHDGRRWYRTGDLVRRSSDGVFTFCGRLKRFVKVGGEMVSLPAVEGVLHRAFPGGGEGPSLAVVATPGERPELVMFTTLDLDRQQANDALRQAGLSALHNLRRVRRLEALPVLGTGKTDYRTLQARLDSVGDESS